jgi:D-proline reductase (dithiol) PrdB
VEQARGDAYWRQRQPSQPEQLELRHAWVTPPPLESARVAIVTTAGLRSEGHAPWSRHDSGFTVIPDGARSLAATHVSQNYDRTGFLADLNVVYPVDRLHELADCGAIGSVASNHLSFMGAQADNTLETLRLDTGPAAAKLLREDGVDVALMTPV